MRGEFTDSVRYRSSRDDISVSSVSLLDQKETCGKAVGVTRRMPTGPYLSFFLLVKSTRDPAFISSSFSPSLPLLYPEPVTAMDRADSSRLAFTAFPEYFLPILNLCSNLHRAIAFFLPITRLQILCKSAYSSLGLDHLPFAMQPKRRNDSVGYSKKKKKKSLRSKGKDKRDNGLSSPLLLPSFDRYSHDLRSPFTIRSIRADRGKLFSRDRVNNDI